MSAWRHRAIELFPDLREEFEDPEATIYNVFLELLPRVREAHARGDNQEMKRLYGYDAHETGQEMAGVFPLRGTLEAG